MKNLEQLPGCSVAVEEASAWRVKADRGLSSEEREEMQRWIEASPANRQALTEAMAVWDDVDMIRELAEIFPLERYATHKSTQHAGRMLMGAAFALAVMLVVSSAWYGLETRRTAKEYASLNATHSTGLGQQTVVQLPDGSRVTLNTNSRMDIRFDSTERGLYLNQGEAYFEVAHDETRPFKVRTPLGEVTAVGTAFNVRLKSAGMSVLVTEGAVRLGDGEGHASMVDDRVRAGEMATLGPGVSLKAVLEPADAETDLAWRKGVLVFNDTPLELALAEFSRYLPMEFVFADDEIRGIPVGGYFRIDDVEGLLLSLENNVEIRVERSRADRVVLRRSQRRLE